MKNGDTQKFIVHASGNNPSATALNPGSDLVLKGIDFHHIIPQAECFAIGAVLQIVSDPGARKLIAGIHSGEQNHAFALVPGKDPVTQVGQRFRAARSFGFNGPSDRVDNLGQAPEPVKPYRFPQFKWDNLHRARDALHLMVPGIDSASNGMEMTFCYHSLAFDRLKQSIGQIVKTEGTGSYAGYVHPFWAEDWCVAGDDADVANVFFYRETSGPPERKTHHPKVTGLQEYLMGEPGASAWVAEEFEPIVSAVGGDRDKARHQIEDAKRNEANRLVFRVRRPNDAENFFASGDVRLLDSGKRRALLGRSAQPCFSSLIDRRLTFFHL